MELPQYSTGTAAFAGLNPETVLQLVEEGLGLYCSNLCRPLNSYINRVFELEDEDGQGMVVKFYRPGRWSPSALQDEHDFLLDLAAAEIPVIPPLKQQNGSTLGHYHDLYFAVFPRKGGRYVDELNEEQWVALGHLLGRTHAVGATRKPVDRPLMRPDASTRSQVEYIIQSGLIDPDQSDSYQAITTELINELLPLFEGVELIRIHGDCHSANLIYRPDESFYLIDLDDMVVGPPVQDFWMLLPDVLEESYVYVDLLLEGYETFRPFDMSSLRLIEPLRAMRFIHYTAWCAHQVAEDGRSEVIPNFGTREYWQEEIRELQDQLERIRDGQGPVGNML